ncbi:hypothetical protein [Streptomyces sp. BH105]|uniref:hypothetical protein n=1 Tax=Streptomyces sp. BH105 TaxID=3410408 RepID=UPI003CEC7E66
MTFPNSLMKTAKTYAIDLAERVLATFVVAAAGVAVAAGPADTFRASFWQTLGVAGIAAVGSLVKGLAARFVAAKNSASLAKNV